ncbi:aminotransferase class III-fold pyridoxal phosphate-dependent enzyme [Epibacterium sp. SM1969]|uniref:Aminotransferase class III-fold pyridoxal phosphate-dependent enzyme n=1 Tax=Tritonibacter aquimaris TaxID=2663379 RepID=A0A844ANC0_9RHOB|nr:aminotransferase class III-fold pyridoxal phosphate-dependent enzyme [Tritonibacter aquimaris]MQY43809.1 aminotransferase class III-fold pyridoxal phosphate-dependent enzyme [Tritonibacter aquimaris]
MTDSNFLKENNARYFWHPMAHPADSQKNPPTILQGGEGVSIIDVDGHKTIDAVGGLWNVNLGYSCEPVKQAISDQLNALPYYSTFRGSSNDKAIELSYELAQFFEPDGLTRAFYTSGGSDSVEVALKLARQYHKIRGEAGRTKFISLKQGYHGTHFAAASVNGNQKFRAAYEPMMPGCFHVPAPWTYRNPFDETDPERLAQLCVNALEAEIAFQGANTVAAFIMEPVLGAGGVIPPHKSFMPMVRDLCSKHGILLISDEIITAFGRTGSETGARHWGVQPDIMTTAKAITNGYFPFGAAMISGAVAEVFETDTTGKASVDQGYTYSGHPVGAAAALAALAETKRLRIWENAAVRGDEMFEGLKKLAEKHDVIGDVRGGEGLMCALELVSDRASKTPVAKHLPMQVQKAAYEDGVMVRVSGNNIILSPPLVVTSGDVAKILSALDTGLSTL